MSLLKPVAGTITQGFLGDFNWEKPGWVKKINGIWRGSRTKVAGWTYRAHAHLAIDYKCPDGTPVRAAHDGKIVYQGKDSTDGAWYLYLQVRRGLVFKVTLAYWHLSPNTFKHRIGDRVKAGTILALSGHSGKATGPHLHFEMWKSLIALPLRSLFSRSRRIDPAPFLAGLPLTRIA